MIHIYPQYRFVFYRKQDHISSVYLHFPRTYIHTSPLRLSERGLQERDMALVFKVLSPVFFFSTLSSHTVSCRWALSAFLHISEYKLQIFDKIPQLYWCFYRTEHWILWNYGQHIHLFVICGWISTEAFHLVSPKLHIYMYAVLPLWRQLKRNRPSVSDGSGSIPNGLSKLQTSIQQYTTLWRHSRMENKKALCCILYFFIYVLTK